jgi:diguanylate cyclase (GGDEF)-like protein/PAS domain S-box-containing protein
LVAAGLTVVALFVLESGPWRTAAVTVAFVLMTASLARLAVGRRRGRPPIEHLIDPVTGLPNRTHAELFLEREFAVAELGRPFAVVLFDIDNFGAFNRKNGDAAANGVLRTIATILRQNTRRMNISARFGPDEFVCLLSGAADDGAFIFAQRIQERLRAAGAVATLPTTSVGIGCYTPDMTLPTALLRAAERALRSAQDDGGDRIRVAGWTIEQLDSAPSRLGADLTVTEPGARESVQSTSPVARTAFVLIGDATLRRRITDALARSDVRVTQGETVADGLRPLNAEFDVVVLDLLAGGVPDMIREVRLRYPATCVVGVTHVTTAALDPAVLTVRVDGRYLEQEGEWTFAPPLEELLRERDRERNETVRSRQLSDEVRAREREAQRVVEQAEARLRSVEHAIQEVVFEIDAHGAWASLSPAWSSITGRRIPDALGKIFTESFHEDDRNDLAAAFASLTNMSKPYIRREARILLSNAGARWVEMRAQVALDRTGRAVGTTGTLIDITARKVAEDALRQSEEYFRALIEYASDMVAVFDERGILRYASPSLERVLGYDAEDRLARTAFDLVHPDDIKALRHRVRRLFRRVGSSTTIELRVRHVDGSWRILALSVRNLTHLPAVRGFVTNARDVTAVRAAESAVRERDEELYRARKMDAIGTLAGGIAHDFNNLLTAIQGHADLVLGEMPSDQASRRDVLQIQAAASRAASLTRQLLAFGRRLVLRPELFDLNVLVSDMQKLLVRLAGDTVRLRTELAASPPYVQADPARIEQVILNLALNAREAMPGGGQLTIRTDNVMLDATEARHHELPPGRYVRLSVTDTGSGIPASALPHVFDPFFTTKGEEGAAAGLGLSTVYGMIKQSGGNVTVTSHTHGSVAAGSASESGTTFVVLLAQASQPTSRVVQPHDVESDRGTETIALVEDEKAVRDLAARILRNKGYNVLPAENGRHAIDVIAKYPHRIDMIVTDVVMPEMNGRDLADRIHVMRPGVKILFMSGYSAEAVARHGVLARGAAFLEKPFSPAVLLRKVREMLDTEAEPAAN